MSFIKIKDPRKREELIKDLIETRKRIKDNFIAKKVGESEYQTGLTKLFKPITETQKATAKEITEAQKEAVQKITGELLPIKESLEKIPALTFPDFPAVEMTKEEKTDLGPIAKNALIDLAQKEGIDKVFGITVIHKRFYIGDKPIKIKGDDIKIDDKVYPGTLGLWELIISQDPQEGEIIEEDYLNYGRILRQTNAIYQNNDPDQNKPKSSKSYKWKNLIKPIWEDIKPKSRGKGRRKRQDDPQPSTSGTGLTILPSDPNALIDRFDLLFSSQNAGHTGVRNEIISILDELKRQGVINTKEYKKLNHVIKK